MHTHNLPDAPGALLGYLKNGRPFYLIAGGSGEDGGNDSGNTEGQGETGSGNASQNDSGSEGGNGSGGRDDAGSGRNDRGQFTGSDDEDKTGRTIAAIRDDFKAERGKRQAAEKELASVKAAQAKLQEAVDSDKADRAKQMDALAVALGLKSGDEPPDPEKLAAELKAAQEKAQAEISQRDNSIRQSQIELAVLRNAGKHDANGDALLDSRSFMAKVGKLDPASDSFGDDLAEAIKSAVESSPQYKAGAKDEAGGKDGSGGRKPPARSGGEHTHPGGNRQWTVEEAKAIAKSDPKALQEAIKNGLLIDIGYPPPK